MHLNSSRKDAAINNMFLHLRSRVMKHGIQYVVGRNWKQAKQMKMSKKNILLVIVINSVQYELRLFFDKF
jgi:hypothetical protein